MGKEGRSGRAKVQKRRRSRRSVGQTASRSLSFALLPATFQMHLCFCCRQLSSNGNFLCAYLFEPPRLLSFTSSIVQLGCPFPLMIGNWGNVDSLSQENLSPPLRERERKGDRPQTREEPWGSINYSTIHKGLFSPGDNYIHSVSHINYPALEGTALLRTRE